MTTLYRKWRSRSFEDLVGQDHVVRTLRNAVRQERVGHAYLFTGPRGTGKTSAARILAKAVNCLNPQDGNPCNRCEACTAHNEGRALDVIEIDAASNTSVENVRDLRERVAYAASEGRYKVYIIDEVHRLSAAAFDAFLKTLEEPPSHVIFVFASTEPHKVPATIMSRCQRFDFRRIAPVDAFSRLREIAAGEALDISDEGIELIVQHSRGSLRDALVLLDQVQAYSDGGISASDVRTALGVADPLLVSRITESLLAGQIADALQAVQNFVGGGGEPRQLLHQLVGYWRGLLLAVSGAGAASQDVDPALRESVGQFAVSLTPAAAVAVVDGLTDCEFSSKYDTWPSLSLEMALVQASLALQKVRQSSGRAIPTDASLPEIRAASPAAQNQATVQREPVPVDQREPTSHIPQVEANGAGGTDVELVWGRIIESMRPRSATLQAILRSGTVMKVENGEVTVGFMHEFHRTQFSDPRKRRMLEEVIAEVTGATYRVVCVRATKEEIGARRGVDPEDDDDGFAEEAAERLRVFHARQIRDATS